MASWRSQRREAEDAPFAADIIADRNRREFVQEFDRAKKEDLRHAGFQDYSAHLENGTVVRLVDLQGGAIAQELEGAVGVIEDRSLAETIGGRKDWSYTVRCQVDGKVWRVAFGADQLLVQTNSPASAKYAAEFIGTFFLVFVVGCNVRTASVGAAISIGAMLMVMIYALGSVSGAHFNPAVTLAILASGRGKISPLDAGLYVVSQVLGGIVGGTMYYMLTEGAFLMRPSPTYTALEVVGLEIVYTWALCYVVLNVATTTNKETGNGENGFFGLAIGFTVTAAAIAIGPVSGCSLNPAVSIGAMHAAYFDHGGQASMYWAAYVFAPCAGALVAAISFYAVQGGLTGRYEYKPVHVREAGPQLARAEFYSEAIERPRFYSRRLTRGDTMNVAEEVVSHKIGLGLRWRMRSPAAADEMHTHTLDIDASCVKFGADGKELGAVYFAEKQDMDGIHHSGEDRIGSCRGRKGEDNETIIIPSLDGLSPDVHALMFVVTIFTAGMQSFNDVEDFSVRLVDMDTDPQHELCHFQREHFLYDDVSTAAASKGTSTRPNNALVVGMLYKRQGRWYFKVVDESHAIIQHGTYRHLRPHLLRSLAQVQDSPFIGSMV